MKENTKEAINLPIKKDEFSQKRRVVWAVIGDVLATVMLYAFGRAIFRASPINLAIFVFVISLFIEALQYFKILEILGVKSSILRIIFGGTFDWTDIICYLVGCILAYVFENLSMQKSKTH